jgi:DNA primase
LRLQIVKALAEVSRLAPDEVERLCELKSLAKRAAPAQPHHNRAPKMTSDKQLLCLLLDQPQLVSKISDEQRLLLDSNPEYQPAAELVRVLKEGRLATAAAILETMRQSKHFQLYEQAVADTLIDMGDELAADADLAGILTQLELRHVESEYRRLSAKGVCDETDRQHFQKVSRRLNELKGGAAAHTPAGAPGT